MKIRSVDIALKKPGSDSQQMGRVGAGGKHRFVKVFVGGARAAGCAGGRCARAVHVWGVWNACMRVRVTQLVSETRGHIRNPRAL